ncbi:MAG: hypothetical protein EHM93_19025 [Bacteroidales bacterium]|nr:MAG: hypothetical protein EHM93_19025 [Bacteroidales bacterium]
MRNNLFFKLNFLTISTILFSTILEVGGSWLLEVLYHDFLRYLAAQIFLGILVYYLFSIFRTKLKKKIWEYTSGLFLFLSVVIFVIIMVFFNNHFSKTEDGFGYLKGRVYSENAIIYKAQTNETDDQLVESVSNNVNLIWADSDNIKTVFFTKLMILNVLLVLSWCSYLQLRKFDRKTTKSSKE